MRLKPYEENEALNAIWRWSVIASRGAALMTGAGLMCLLMGCGTIAPPPIEASTIAVVDNHRDAGIIDFAYSYRGHLYFTDDILQNMPDGGSYEGRHIRPELVVRYDALATRWGDKLKWPIKPGEGIIKIDGAWVMSDQADAAFDQMVRLEAEARKLP